MINAMPLTTETTMNVPAAKSQISVFNPETLSEAGGADIRPDFRWEKQSALARGF